MFKISEAFETRPIEYLRLHKEDDWRLKVYSIVYGDKPLDAEAYEAGMALAMLALPRPAQHAERPGVGFVVLHQGRGLYYLVLNWWDNENELFNRVFVRRIGKGESWRPATDGESACVWDLEIMWFERQAYVQTVLASRRGDIDGYLQRRMNTAVKAGGTGAGAAG